MTRSSLVIIAAIGLAGFDGLMAQSAPGAQRPRFRAVAEAVFVPVAVTEGNRPVAGLTSGDFELLDNGVPQELSSTEAESLAIDVSLVVDTSGSVEGPALLQFKSALQDIAVSLRPNDRVRLMTFGTSVLDITGFQPGGAPLPLERLQVGGGTSFYHALAAALMSTRSAERPQLIVAFSDGLDNLSLTDARMVTSLAGHTNASLYLLLARRPAQVSLRGVAPWTGQPDVRMLRDAAEKTGGEYYEPRLTDPLPVLFDRVIDEFRTRYLLRYIPSGVASPGWHEITVRVKGNKKFTVRARKGYEGG